MLKVELKVISPLLVVKMIGSFATDELKVTPLRKLISAPAAVAVMLPPSTLAPAPSCVMLPTTTKLAPVAVVNVPALLTSIVPPTVLLPTPLKVKWLPVKSKLLAKVASPVKVVVPVPATWVKLLAFTVLANVVLLAEVTVILPPVEPGVGRFVNATAPTILISPVVPAINCTDSLF